MADASHRVISSPFSANTVQQKPLFSFEPPASHGPHKALSINVELPISKGSLILAKHAVHHAPVKAPQTPDAPRTRTEPLLASFPAILSRRAPSLPEAEEAQFGELSAYDSDASADASVGLTEAVSVAPRDGAMPPLDCDGPVMGFWADVGAMSAIPELPVDADDFSEWESASDSDDSDAGGNDDLLLPWDL